MNDRKNIGEEVEDVVENIVSGASPLEDEKDEGGTDVADRDGEAALDDDDNDDATFTA